MSDVGSGWFGRKRKTASRSHGNSKENKPRSRRTGIIALEPRMMYDGAAVATAATAGHGHDHHHHEGADHGPMASADKHLDQLPNVATANAQASGSTPPSGTSSSNTNTHTPDTGREQWHHQSSEPMPHVTTRVKDPTEIVFIDPQAPDYQILAAGVKPGIEVVVLDPNSDGVQQIANFLARHPDPNLTTIDIVAHGEGGMLFLGNAVLDNATVGQYAAQLKTIGAAMQPGGDLMLYGCDVAATSDGLILLDQIVQGTGANVAASAGPVGSSAEGGTWTLNVTAGPIDASNPFTAATQAMYPDVLNADLIGITNDGGNGDGIVVGTDANGSTPGGATGVAFTTASGLSPQAGNPQQIQLDVADGFYFVLLQQNGIHGAEILKGTLSQVLGGGTPTFTTLYQDPSLTNDVNSFQVDVADNVIFFNHLTNANTPSASDTVELLTFSGAHFAGTATAHNISSAMPNTDLVGMVVDPVNHVAYFYETHSTTTEVGSGGRTQFGNPATKNGGIATGTKQTLQTIITQDQLFKGAWVGGNGPSSNGFVLTAMPIAQQGNSSTLGSNNLPTSLGQIADLAIDTVDQVLYFDTNSINGSTSGIYGYGLGIGNAAGLFNTVWTQTAAVPGALSDLVIDPQTSKYYVSVQDGTTVGKNDIYDGSLNGGAAPTKFITVNTTSDSELTPLGLAVDNTPTVTASASTVVYNAGTTPVVVDHPGAGISISDSTGTVASATVSVTGNFQSGGDVLGFAAANLTGNTINGTNITESYSSSTGVLTLSGTDTTAHYALAMSEVIFSSTLAAPSTSPRTITFGAKDGFGGGVNATDTVDVHDLPIVTAGATASFSGGSGPVTLDGVLNVTDASSTTLASATVSITSGFLSGDTLSFTNNGTSEGNIAGSYDAGTGVLTLTSAADTATVGQWKTALQSITYGFSPTNGDPTGGINDNSRTITWVVNDGASQSTPVTSSVVVAHLAPTVTAGASVTFTGGATLPVVLDSTLSVNDIDSGGTLTSATITIGGFITGDTLNFVNNGTTEGNIAITTNSGGTLVLTSADHSATLTQWTAALDSIRYIFLPTNGDPTGGVANDTSRTISWTVNDGVANSATKTSSLTVVHAPPVVTAGATATYETGSIAPVALDAALTVTDPDSGGNLTSATVQIGANFVANADVLTFTNQSGITTTYDGVHGTLSLTTTTPQSIAAFQAVLDSVAFSTSSTSTAARSISWTVNDGSSSHATDSPAATSTVNVEIGPHITTGGTVALFAGGSTTPVVLDSTVLTDPSSTTLSGATISIGSPLSGDTLNFINQHNITGSYNSTTGVLSLTGQDSLTNYATALGSITYSFTPVNGDPTGTGADTSRTISWTVTDGTANSNTATSALSISHTSPLLTAGASVNYEIGGTAAVVLDAGLLASDADSNGNLAGATVKIVAAAAGDTLNFTGQNGITVLSNVNGVLKLTGTSSVANYQTALESITFSTTSTSTTARSIAWQVNDDNTTPAGTSNTAGSTVNVLAGPHVTAGASVTFTGGDSPVALDSGLALTDAFGTTLTGATVSIASGGIAVDTLTINGTTSGDINNGASGTIHYQLTGSTLNLSGTDTVADYQAALDLVKYSVSPANSDPTGASVNSTSRAIDWTVTDGNATSTASSTLTTVHTAPVVTAGAAVNYEIGSTTPVTLDGGLTVTDVDSGGNLTSATVTIAVADPTDRLAFTSGNGITGTYLNGVLSLTGTASVAAYQEALDSVVFSTSATTAGSRSISWTVTDGSVTHGSGTAGSTVNVLAGPQVTSGGTVNFTGGGSPVTLDPTLAVADPFSTTLASATVTIASGSVTGDALTINGTTVGDINDGGNGSIHYQLTGNTLQLSGTDTVADYQAALDAVKFDFTANGDPTGGAANSTSRGITWQINDGHANSNLGTSALTVTHVAPTVTAGATAVYELGQPAQLVLDAGLTTNDVDSGGTLSGATITITTNADAGDTLHFTAQNGITGTLAGDALTLSGTASIADYQAALESITFSTTSSSTLARTITWTVNDASVTHNTSAMASSTVAVTNGPIVIAGASASFTQGDAPIVLDPTLSVHDLNVANLTGATVTIEAAHYVSGGDTLNFTNQNNITGSFDAATGVLTLTGTDTVTDYQAALESVTYSFSPANGDPTAGGTNTSRTIDWSINDAVRQSATTTSSLTTIATTNTATALVVRTSGSTVTYDEGGSAVHVDSRIVVLDAANLAGATVTIATGLQSNDTLGFSSINLVNGNQILGTNITETYGNGVLTLTGSDSAANYSLALSQVIFSSTSSPLSTAPRTIIFAGTDVNNVTASGNDAIDIHDKPVVTAGATFNYTSGGPAVVLDNSLSVTDASSATLQSATASIANFVDGDTLNFTDQNGIHGVYDATTGSLTLTGSASVADYQQALESVSYSYNFSSVNVDPTAAGANVRRTIDWSVNDGTLSSVTATSALNVLDAQPVVTAGGTATFRGGGSPVTLDGTLTVSDAPEATITGATVTIASGFSNGAGGTDTLSFSDGVDPANTQTFTDGATITAIYDSTSSKLSLTGNASVADYQTVLQEVQYSFSPTNGDPTVAGTDTSRTIDWTVTDFNGKAATASSSLSTVHEAPTVTASGIAAYGIGSGTAVALDGAAMVADVDSGGNLSSATVTIGTGFASGDVLNFTVHGGIIGAYDAGTGVLKFTGSDTLANYAATLDSITFQTSVTTVGSRSISWVVTDPSAINGTSATATSTVDVLVGPAVTAGGTATFTGGGTAQVLDAGLSVQDPFSTTFASATVTIENTVSGDTLNFTPTAADGDITAVAVNNGTQLLLTSAGGHATQAQWDAALDSVTYGFSPTNGDPTNGGARTVTKVDWTINDGTADSSIATSTLNLVHVPPTLTAGTTVNFEIGSTAGVPLDGALTVTDIDSSDTLSGATVTIGHFTALDSLSFTAVGNITGTYDAGTGTLKLQGNDTVENYQTALDSVTFVTTSTVASSHNITWSVSDPASSTSASSSLNVEVGPVVTPSGATATFTGGGSAQQLDPGISVADTFSTTLSSATVTILGAISGDTLNFTPTAADGDITAVVSGNQIMLTSAHNDATLTQWDAALDSITYSFTPGNGDPTGDGTHTSRTIDWQVNDGHADSAIVSSTLDIAHAPPVVTPSATAATYEVGSTAAVPVNPGLTLQDVDSGDTLIGVTVKIDNFVAGDTLNFTSTAKITTAGFDTVHGALTLSGNDTVADYQAALDSITFQTSSTTPSSRTIDWTVSDPVSTTTASSTLNVVAGPVMTASGTVTFNGGDPGTVLDSTASVTDSSGMLSSATVTIGAGLLGTDTLSADTTGTHITAAYSNGVLKLTGSDTTANYDKVLDSVTFASNPTNADPSNGTRTIDWIANDGVANSNTASSTIDTVHVGPTLTVGASSAYGIGGLATVLDSSVAITDVDSGGDLTGATVTISIGSPTDKLHFTDQNGITGQLVGGSVLNLQGNASIADYEAALESITFTSGAAVPETEHVTWTVTDGVGSTSALSTVDVVSGPTVTAGATAIFSGGSASPAVLDGGLAINDPLSPTLASATVTIGTFVSGDTLNFTNDGSTEGNISIQSNASGVLKLVSTGNTATTAEWDAALDSVTYSFTAPGDPTAGGARPTTTINWQVNDGTSNSPVASSTLDLVHVVPVVTAGQSATFIGGGSPVSLDPGHALTITDLDSGGDLNAASVSIGVGFVFGDTLSAVTGGTHITATYDNVNGILSLNGQDSIANYLGVLDSVTFSFSPTNADPTSALTDTNREIHWVVNDGVANSTKASSTVNVVHAPPTVTAGSTVTFTGGSATPVTIDSTLTLTAPDSSGELTGATVTIASGLVNTANDQDVLSFNGGSNTEHFAADNATITATYSNGQLTFNGTASVADYQTALEQVQYFFHSSVVPGSPNIGDPTAGGNDTARTIVWQVNDGLALSPTGVGATSAIDTVHVAPSLTAGGTVTFVGGSPTPVLLDGAATVTDVDSDGLLTKMTVSISSGFIAGDTLTADTTGLAITQSYSNGVLTLTGSDTLADYRHVLDSVAYSFNPANGDPTGGGGHTTRTVTFVASDASTSHGSSLPATVTVDTVHVAPVVTAGGAATFNQALSGASVPAALDAMLGLVDVDSAGLLSGATVKITAGFVAGDTLTANTAGTHITASYSNGLLTLSGTDSVTDYQNVLDSISFSSANPNPSNDGANPSRTLAWQVTDGNTGNGVSNLGTTTLNVVASPHVVAGADPSYNAGPGTSQTLDVTLAAFDGNPITGATVTITSGFADGDTLSAVTSGTGIQASYDATRGVLTLTGTDTPQHYQAVLESIALASNQPTSGTVTLAWQITDSLHQVSAVATSNVEVTAHAGGVPLFTVNPVTPSSTLTSLANVFDNGPTFQTASFTTEGTGGNGGGFSFNVVHTDPSFTTADANVQINLELAALAAPLGGDIASIEARQADGKPLPDWLKFDPKTGTFAGTPPDNAVASLAPDQSSDNNIVTGTLRQDFDGGGRHEQGSSSITVEVLARDSKGNLAVTVFTIDLHQAGQHGWNMQPFGVERHAALVPLSPELAAIEAAVRDTTRAIEPFGLHGMALGHGDAISVGGHAAVPAGRAGLTEQMASIGWRSMAAQRNALLASLQQGR